ncbi:acyl-CoA dehydrogenase [Sphingopyxis indica]|uniref:acyl-CoA dehydrogenase family protein n=1 Tax=Sphingopyxis indica TaxID=436663 RepID=UPI00293905B7|nr:acyl-CoA dehydrogenase family protein [Sphingopyxis indica]WOF41930.1 acyl-CoA dehydrogenase [Sphingopyxis indica]
MDHSDLLEPFDRMLAAIAAPEAVRAIERGGAADAMWGAVATSGFLDALVPEAAGGFGLPAAAVQPLWQALGRHAVPLPVGETMIARALLAGAGVAAPGGPIVLTVAEPGRPVVVPLGRIAHHALVEQGDRIGLVEIALDETAVTGVAASLAARIACPPLGEAFGAPPGGLRPLAAILRAALIAGAADRVVTMTASYANERVQFGKPIGRQQALQQNMAVMAEDAVAARIASQLGCAAGFPPPLAAAATAKSVASSTAARIAASAHAVHGAIGISEEHDLQLFTRRLHEWRLADGSESWWNRLLGTARLASDAGSVDFVRAELDAKRPAV